MDWAVRVKKNISKETKESFNGRRKHRSQGGGGSGGGGAVLETVCRKCIKEKQAISYSKCCRCERRPENHHWTRVAQHE